MPSPRLAVGHRAFRATLAACAGLAALTLATAPLHAQTVGQGARPAAAPDARASRLTVPAAELPPAEPTVRVVFAVEGAGAISLRSTGIPCLTRCEIDLRRGQTVTLSAQTGETERFLGWDGACRGNLPRCEITAEAGTTVTARFTGVNAAQRHVTGTPAPAAPSPTPTPAPPSTAEVRVEVIGAGTVRSTPRGIDCRPQCSLLVKLDQEIGLVALPSPASRFVEWRGACRGPAPRCALKPGEDSAVTAVFQAVP